MLLLVSVSSAEEAAATVRGGADIVDAKNPWNGALGAVSADVLCEICRETAGRRPVSAALGDAHDEASVERMAGERAAVDVSLLKVGFAGTTNEGRVQALLRAAIRGSARCGATGPGIVAVAYADSDKTGSVSPRVLADLAARTGASGILLDTFDKAGPGLRELVPARALALWVADAHQAGLFVALAGKLSLEDLPFVRDAGADVAGVRGAACDTGRLGRVTADRVGWLKARCGPGPLPDLPAGLRLRATAPQS